jgi:hypothetical protein
MDAACRDRAQFLGFDCLPNSAQVRLGVVTALFAVSVSTVWRWTNRGVLEVTRVGGTTRWNVGALRRVAGLESAPDREQAAVTKVAQ